MWLHGQDFSEVRILIQHPWSVARANKNMSDPERKILDAWQQHSWIITEKGFDPTACELISDGHKHAQILHCPISKPVERGQTIEFSLTESVHNLEVYRNLSLRAPEAEFQPPSGVVAMCTSPLSGDKARYLPEWIEWHRMFGTEVREGLGGLFPLLVESFLNRFLFVSPVALLCLRLELGLKFIGFVASLSTTEVGTTISGCVLGVSLF
jgi:hypothetical protein